MSFCVSVCLCISKCVVCLCVTESLITLCLSLRFLFILSFTLCLCHFFVLVGKPAHTFPPQLFSLSLPLTHRVFDQCSLPHTLPPRLPGLLILIEYEFLLRQEPPVGSGEGNSRKTFSWSQESRVGFGPDLPVRSQEPRGVLGTWWGGRGEGERGRREKSLGHLPLRPASLMVRHLLPTFPHMLSMW